MNTIIENIKGLFSETPQTPQHTRAQTRKLIFNAIDPLLKQEGFIYKKRNNVWRITKNKTDVIELRFLTLEERRQFKLPESTFSLLYGCYYHFIPDIHNGRFIHQIPDLITPLEVHCHYREKALRTIKQKPKKMDQSAWHLDEEETKQKLILDDVVSQLKFEIFPTVNRLMDLQEWISELESTKSISNLGIGNPNSITRIFLLGFTYKQFGDKTQAEVYLTKAMGLMEENNKKLAQFSKDFPPDAPIFLQLEIIKNAVANMQKQST